MSKSPVKRERMEPGQMRAILALPGIKQKVVPKTDNIEKNILMAYIEVLGRLPDSKVKDDNLKTILAGESNIDILKSDLRLSAEYKNQRRLIRLGKIDEDIAHIDDQTGNIVWTVNIGLDEINKDLIGDYKSGNITYVSTWNIKCGIASYTGYLLNAVNNLYMKEGRSKNIAEVHAINKTSDWSSVNNVEPYKVDSGIVHIQHEFGIMRTLPSSDSNVIVTFHSVQDNIEQTLKMLEDRLNIVAYMAHFDESYKLLSKNTGKDVWLIPHGSKRIAGDWNGTDINKNIDMKRNARDLLDINNFGIDNNDNIAFLFGFQSGNKNFGRIIESCKNTRVKLVISGGKHQCGFTNNIISKSIDRETNNIVFLNKFLNDTEVDLWSLASDMLLFDYSEQNHYSCSGAMHRVIGAGRPVICSRNKHFVDIEEDVDCLKFADQNELEQKIKDALKRRGEFGRKSLRYAQKTYWEVVAKMHLDMYKKYMEI